MGQFFDFKNKLRHHLRHTCVHAARTFVDEAWRGEMPSEIPEMFDAFGPQLNTFMCVRILLQSFRRQLLQFE